MRAPYPWWGVGGAQPAWWAGPAFDAAPNLWVDALPAVSRLSVWVEQAVLEHLAPVFDRSDPMYGASFRCSALVRPDPSRRPVALHPDGATVVCGRPPASTAPRLMELPLDSEAQALLVQHDGAWQGGWSRALPLVGAEDNQTADATRNP